MTGLTDEEAELRFARYGANSLEEVKGPSRVKQLLKQIHTLGDPVVDRCWIVLSG